MTAILDQIEKRDTAAKARAVANYRAIIAREAAGQAQPADTDALVEAMEVLGYTGADAATDVQILSDLATAEKQIIADEKFEALSQAMADASTALKEEEARHASEFRRLQDAHLRAANAHRNAGITTDSARERIDGLRRRGTRLFDGVTHSAKPVAPRRPDGHNCGGGVPIVQTCRPPGDQPQQPVNMNGKGRQTI